MSKPNKVSVPCKVKQKGIAGLPASSCFRHRQLVRSVLTLSRDQHAALKTPASRVHRRQCAVAILLIAERPEAPSQDSQVHRSPNTKKTVSVTHGGADPVGLSTRLPPNVFLILRCEPQKEVFCVKYGRSVAPLGLSSCKRTQGWGWGWG